MMPALLWATSAHAATITVTSIDDDIPSDCSTHCTLRDAVTISSPGDTIELPSGTIYLYVSYGEIVINHDLTIVGAGRDSTYISGNDGTRIFRVTAGELYLEGLTLQDGYSIGGAGGLLTPGTTNGAGGALRIERDAVVHIADVRFSDNQAIGGDGGDAVNTEGGGGGGGHGGAGKAHSQGAGENGYFGGGGGGTAFSNLNGPGGMGGFGGGGGGSGTSMYSPGAGGVGAGRGGDAIGNGYSGGGGGAGMGGAVYVEGALVLNDVEFSGNQAVGGNGGAGTFMSGGGGGGAGMGSALFTRGDGTDTGGLLCLSGDVTFTGGSVAGGNGGAGGEAGGYAGENGSGLETATGMYQDGAGCPTRLEVFSAYAVATTGDTANVLFAAQVTAALGFQVNGEISLTVEDAHGAIVGSPLTTAVVSGQAFAIFKLTGVTPGAYTMVVNFDDPEGRFASRETTVALQVPEAPVAMRVHDLAAGDEDCAQGGLRIESGQDDGDPSGIPFDGVLQDGEVEHTRNICAGSDGATGVDGAAGEDGYPVVVNITPIEEGDEECPAGGHLIEAGLDDGNNDSTPSDGVLQEGEVRSTSRVCHGVVGASGPQGAPGGCSSTGTPPFALMSAVAMILARRRLFLR